MKNGDITHSSLDFMCPRCARLESRNPFCAACADALLGTWAKWLLLVATALLPFAILLAIHVFESNAGLDTWMYIIFFPVGFALFGMWVFVKTKKPRISVLVVALLGWLLIRGTFGRLGLGWPEMVRLTCMAGIMLMVAHSNWHPRGLFLVITATVVGEMLMIWPFQIIWQHNPAVNAPDHNMIGGLTGTFSNENRLTTYFIVALPVSFMVYITERDARWVFAGLFGVLASTAILVLNGSRVGVYLVAPVLAMCYIGATRIYCLSKTRLAVLTALLVAMAVAGWRLEGDVVRKVINEPVLSKLDKARSLEWGLSWQMIDAHWLSGVGPGRWHMVAMRLGKPIYEHPHNEFLQCFAEYGLPGLILCAWIVAIILKTGLKTPFLFAIVGAMLLQGTVHGMRTPEQSFYFALISGIILRNYTYKPGGNHARIPQ